jgi:hypothetical protein
MEGMNPGVPQAPFLRSPQAAKDEYPQTNFEAREYRATVAGHLSPLLSLAVLRHDADVGRMFPHFRSQGPKHLKNITMVQIVSS